jgi:alpha-L-rhamnosidase
LGDLTFAYGEYDSIRGKIISDWKVVDGQFQLNLTIPANTTATVNLPISDAAQVREGERAADQATGVAFLRMEGLRCVFQVGSGKYHFRGPLTK